MERLYLTDPRNKPSRLPKYVEINSETTTYPIVDTLPILQQGHKDNVNSREAKLNANSQTITSSQDDILTRNITTNDNSNHKPAT